jgi:hypothetical protein
VGPAAAQKIVDALDAELAKRRSRRDAVQDADWSAQFAGDEVILFAKRLERDWDRRQPGSEPLAPLGRGARERAEDEVIHLMEIATMVERAERRREDEAAGIRRRPVVKIHVRSEARLLPESPRPKLDPAAPRVVERTGRRGATPMVHPEEDAPVWTRGQVLTFNPRNWTGSVRSADGLEYKIADGTLARSGLMTLVVGMRCECRIVGAEVDLIRAAWH